MNGKEDEVEQRKQLKYRDEGKTSDVSQLRSLLALGDWHTVDWRDFAN